MKFLRLWGPVILWMSIIFLFSTRQRLVVSPEESLNFLFFKSLHIIEYAVLYFLTLRASKNTVTSFIIVILYAISDEIHQLYVFTREGTVRDVIIDALGAGVAWTVITQLVPILPRQLQKRVKSLLGR